MQINVFGLNCNYIFITSNQEHAYYCVPVYMIIYIYIVQRFNCFRQWIIHCDN